MKLFTVEKTSLNIYYCQNRLPSNPNYIGYDRIYISYNLACEMINIKARLQELNLETEKQKINNTLLKELLQILTLIKIIKK